MKNIFTYSPKQHVTLLKVLLREVLHVSERTSIWITAYFGELKVGDRCSTDISKDPFRYMIELKHFACHLKEEAVYSVSDQELSDELKDIANRIFEYYQDCNDSKSVLVEV